MLGNNHFQVRILANYYGIAQYSIVEGNRVQCTALHTCLSYPRFILDTQPESCNGCSNMEAEHSSTHWDTQRGHKGTRVYTILHYTSLYCSVLWCGSHSLTKVLTPHKSPFKFICLKCGASRGRAAARPDLWTALGSFGRLASWRRAAGPPLGSG